MGLRPLPVLAARPGARRAGGDGLRAGRGRGPGISRYARWKSEANSAVWPRPGVGGMRFAFPPTCSLHHDPRRGPERRVLAADLLPEAGGDLAEEERVRAAGLGDGDGAALVG